MPDEFDDSDDEGFKAPDEDVASDEPRGPDGRFKKGHSGNGNGRPLKSRNLKTIVRKALDRPRRFKDEGGQTKTMSAGEAFVEKAIADALKGKMRGSQQLIALMKAAGYFDQPAEPVKKAELTPEEQAILARLMKNLDGDE